MDERGIEANLDKSNGDEIPLENARGAMPNRLLNIPQMLSLQASKLEPLFFQSFEKERVHLG